MIGLLTKIPVRVLFGPDEFKENPDYIRPAWAPDSDTYVLIPDPPPPPRINKK